MFGPGRKRLSHPMNLRIFFLCLLPAACCLLPAAFSQGLFPSQGQRSKDSIATAPQPLGPSAASRDSSARRSGGRQSPGPRPDTVALPYNLVWGDTTGRLSSLFAGVGAKITNKKADGPKEVWTVDGLIAPNLQSSLFTFQAGQLLALEFDYGQQDWTTDKYNEQMGQFRRLLESKCEAPGELISRGPLDTPAPDNPVKETLTGYQWKHGDTIVQLFYFAAEDTSKNQNFRSISVHYHYTDPYAVAPEDTPAPAAGDAAAPAVGAAADTNPLPTDPTHPDRDPPRTGPKSTPPAGCDRDAAARTGPKSGGKPTPSSRRERPAAGALNGKNLRCSRGGGRAQSGGKSQVLWLSSGAFVRL